MKTLFSLCLLLLLSFLCIPQDNKYYEQNQAEETVEDLATLTCTTWVCEQPKSWGSFWWQVERTVKKVDGYYYYTIYVFSNSYLRIVNPDGTYSKAITKINNLGIRVTDKDDEANWSFRYAVFDWEVTYLYEFSSDDPNAKVHIGYESITPYDKSKK